MMLETISTRISHTSYHIPKRNHLERMSAAAAASKADNHHLEIKLITDYRQFLLVKIDELKVSLTQVASSFGDEINNGIQEFSRRMNAKLKMIDDRFTENTNELEALKAELLSKKFDEANFNNVSMIRTLDKTIKERDLKIKELESRVRYLEANSNGAGNASANSAGNGKKDLEPVPVAKAVSKAAIAKEKEAVVMVKEPAVAPVAAMEAPKEDKFKDAPRVVDADGDIVVSVSAKRTRVKTDKKKADASGASAAVDVSTATIGVAVEEKLEPKKVRKIKKASKIEREEDEVKPEVKAAAAPAPAPVIELSTGGDAMDAMDAVDAAEAQRLADEEREEEAVRLAEERKEEERRLAEEESQEAERLEEQQRQEEEEELRRAAEAEKKKKTDDSKKQVISKKDSKDSKKIIAKTPVKSAPAPEPEPLEPPTKSKEPTKVQRGYPDKLPEVEDLDVITVGTRDYYLDKNNQGVYQMINGDDIGTFLGYYDSNASEITPVD